MASPSGERVRVVRDRRRRGVPHVDGRAWRLAERSRGVARGLALTAATGAALYPLVWLVLASLKTRSELATNPWGLPHHWTVANFASVVSDTGLLTYFKNSVLIACFTVGLGLTLGVPAAYAIARLNLRGARLALLTFLLAEMIPAAIIVVPILLTYQWLGIDDSRLRLIVAYTVATMGFTVFMVRGSFLTIPGDLREAARLDGCNELQVFLRVMVPLARSAIVVVAVFCTIFVWNEYFLALVLVTDGSARTLPLGLTQLQGPYSSDWPKIAAMVVLSAMPTLALYAGFQKRIAQRMGRSGALK